MPARVRLPKSPSAAPNVRTRARPTPVAPEPAARASSPAPPPPLRRFPPLPPPGSARALPPPRTRLRARSRPRRRAPGVAVRVRHLRHPLVLVAPVADDHRHPVQVRKLRPGREAHAGCEKRRRERHAPCQCTAQRSAGVGAAASRRQPAPGREESHLRPPTLPRSRGPSREPMGGPEPHSPKPLPASQASKKTEPVPRIAPSLVFSSFSKASPGAASGRPGRARGHLMLRLRAASDRSALRTS